MAKKAPRESNGVKEMRERVQRARKALAKVGAQIAILQEESQKTSEETPDVRVHIFASPKESQKRKGQKTLN